MSEKFTEQEAKWIAENQNITGNFTLLGEYDSKNLTMFCFDVDGEYISITKRYVNGAIEVSKGWQNTPKRSQEAR